MHENSVEGKQKLSFRKTYEDIRFLTKVLLVLNIYAFIYKVSKMDPFEVYYYNDSTDHNDVKQLYERVDKMENCIGNIVSKIDAVLNKMAAMDRAKVKRRENMNKILNTISESNDLDEKSKRHHMEKMVREELQRWDSDTSLKVPSGNLPKTVSPKKSK